MPDIDSDALRPTAEWLYQRCAFIISNLDLRSLNRDELDTAEIALSVVSSAIIFAGRAPEFLVELRTALEPLHARQQEAIARIEGPVR